MPTNIPFVMILNYVFTLWLWLLHDTVKRMSVQKKKKISLVETVTCSPEMKDCQTSEERQTFQHAADSTAHATCLSYHLHRSSPADLQLHV